MSIWKELRCDRNGPDCLDNQNAGPMGSESASALRRRAKREGWHRVDGDDVCPECWEPEPQP